VIFGVVSRSSATFDRVGGVGDRAAEVQQVTGGSPVLVGVFQVGVELAGEPVFGVSGEQAQHHLQGAAVRPVQGGLGVGVDLVAGQLGGDPPERVGGSFDLLL